MDFVSSKIAVARPSWHGKDNILTREESKDIDVVVKKANLDFTLVKNPIYMPSWSPRVGQSGWEHLSELAAIVRTDTGDHLSIVSSSYHIVQPKEILEFFRDVVTDFDWHIESAGSLKGGRIYWALAKTGVSMDFAKEHMDSYVLLLSSCDKSRATIGMFTNVFVVCWNTLNMALSKPGYYIKCTHDKAFDADLFKRELGVASASLSSDTYDVTQMYKEYTNVRMNQTMLLDYFSHVAAGKSSLELEDWDEVYKDDDLTEPKHPQIVTSLMKAMQEAPGQSLPGRSMTLWGAINAVTYWTDHVRGSDYNRGFSVVSGAADYYKKAALTLAEEYV